jgi:hypothetical protein
MGTEKGKVKREKGKVRRVEGRIGGRVPTFWTNTILP